MDSKALIAVILINISMVFRSCTVFAHKNIKMLGRTMKISFLSHNYMRTPPFLMVGIINVIHKKMEQISIYLNISCRYILLLIANWKTHDAVARSSNAHSRSSKALTKLNAASSSSKAPSFSRNWSTSRISDPDFCVNILQEKLTLKWLFTRNT